jgi:hypothetical protein
MKVITPLALALVALTMGCAANHDKIVFSDESDVRAAAAASTAAHPAAKDLEKADELQIEQVIFGYLLERHFWDLADYSAVFLQTDDSQVDALMKKYPGHVPPVKSSEHAAIQPGHAPLDKDTGKPAMILSTEINAPNPNGTVDAVGRWYAGDAVTGFRSFHLTKINDDWQITDVK